MKIQQLTSNGCIFMCCENKLMPSVPLLAVVVNWLVLAIFEATLSQHELLHGRLAVFEIAIVDNRGLLDNSCTDLYEQNVSLLLISSS
jgi:hypothetical protein